MKTRLFVALLFGISVLPALQGCFPVVAAGVTTGVMAAADRRSVGTQTEDESLEWKASASTAGIKNYVILKDGQKVYEGLATKFVDFRVEDGRKYKYQLYAVNTTGRQSAVTTLEKTYKCSAFGLIDCKFQ